MKHLSYRQFKNIFGDLGVTAWTKFNWLSNGLPDGEYNGITKVTYTALPNNAVAQVGGFYWNMNVIPTTSDKVWSYGFSNWPIIATQQWGNKNKDLIGISNVMNIHIEGLERTKEAYNAYLKEHPLIIYYYDKNEWGGTIITDGVFDSDDHYLYKVVTGAQNKEVKDVQGEFENMTLPSPSWGRLKDKHIASSLTNDYVLIRDNSINTYNQFLNKYLPRAIVYRLSSTQLLSLQSEDSDLEETEE